MPTEFGVVDLFAGPGGLAEGFSSIRNKDGSQPFQIALSVEKESSAFETLRLRSFFRQFNGSPPADYYRFLNEDIPEPDWQSLFPAEWARACLETLKLELGLPGTAQEIDARLAQITKSYRGNVILIGGPPCQAYSLVGRARNRGTEGYEASKDHRHFLYKEYIRILQTLMPAAFVMENVKGLLSSSVDGERVFDQVLDDLAQPMRDKRKKFIQLAEARVARAMNDIRLIGNLSNRSAYTYAGDDVRKIFKALQRELDAAKSRFGDETGSKEAEFRLED
jgi:DNA (cytosine-5)-methyltransferase 1